MSSTASNTAPRSGIGNVLVLVDLYAAASATAAPSPPTNIPMLTSRTMHTLYAFSLLVYSLDSVFNWLHVYNVLQGMLTSFPLRLWFVLVLAMSSVAGTMLIVLLVMLCVENAFIHRLNFAEHKSGLVIIFEAIAEWLQSFNNFRVGFLFMAMHDAPITLSNFFLLSACRCSGPQAVRWTLFLSVVGTTMSLCWRLLLLYFAYSRLVFDPPRANSNSSVGLGVPSTQHSFHNESSLILNSRLDEEGKENERRMQNKEEQQQQGEDGEEKSGIRHFDECWPIRWSTAFFYGACSPSTNAGDRRRRTLYLEGDDYQEGKRSLGKCCGFWLSWLVLRSLGIIRAVLLRLLYMLSTLLLCSASLAVCCTPCLHTYFCRSDSLYRRHKCANSLVRRCTFVFHYFVLLFSLLLSVMLIGLNLVLLSSVHLAGPNNWPPEISRLCISIDKNRRIIHPQLLPDKTLLSSFFHWPSGHSNDEQHRHSSTQCKSLWDLPHPRPLSAVWAPGIARISPGPWQARIPLLPGSDVLAVSTHFVYDSRLNEPKQVIFFDFALLSLGIDNNSTHASLCRRRQSSGWIFASRSSPSHLGFPYFLACSPSIHYRKAALIDCQALVANIQRTLDQPR